MDTTPIIFWFVFTVAIAGVIVTARQVKHVGRSWVFLYAGILIADIAGWAAGLPLLIYAGGVVWAVFVLLPGLLGQRFNRKILQQDYAGAKRLARIIGLLHPNRQWRLQNEVLGAMILVQEGKLDDAKVILERNAGGTPAMRLSTMTHYFRMSADWEGLLAWNLREGCLLEQNPHYLPILMRCYGEIGDSRKVMGIYRANSEIIAKLNPPSTRELCRLVLFAFCGRRSQVELTLKGLLSDLPMATKQFWLATSEWAAGNVATALALLDSPEVVADRFAQAAVVRRREQILIGKFPDLSELDEAVFAQAAIESKHDETYGTRSPIFSRAAAGTLGFLLLNCAMFGAELYYGSSTDPEVLYRLGALYPPSVYAGEWWRLGAATILHVGPLHLVMNMLGLWALGPFVERMVGFWRFLLLCVLTGLGSMGMLMTFVNPDGPQPLGAGASGVVMGLVGAMLALMLRGWLQDRSAMARRRLLVIIFVVGMQCLIDYMVPEISMTAHVSGMLIGFALSLGLRRKT